jgi:glycosyltransferase involved in cell wall biosynthesis
MVQDYSDVEITLIGPTEYICADWGEPINLALKAIEQNRFRFIPLQFVFNRVWNRLFQSGSRVVGLSTTLKQIRPDLIYLIGTGTEDVTFQVAWVRKHFMPKTKIALFTMSGVNMPLHDLLFCLRWKLTRSFIDAFYCHCPRSVDVLRSQGKVWQPIYMQTQVGVNVDIFKPDGVKRQWIREKLGVKDDEYLFGSVSRMDIRKGLLDMVDALPVKAKWKFVMIGSGSDQRVVEDAVRARGLTEQVLLPGFVDLPYGVAEYINALDCSVLMSKTLPNNCDTFALAVAQSMAIGLPVIVSDSGGLAYQVGKEGIVVHEGDIEGLHKAMEYVSSNPEKGREIGAKMRTRLLNSFSVPHLNHCFYDTVRDIINGVVNTNHIDQQDFTFAD